MRKILLKAPTKEQNRISKEFAIKCTPTNSDEYSDRDQNDIKKRCRDHYHSKLMEFMVYNYHVEEGIPVSMVDVNIYEVADKSFDADLISDGVMNIHVKSCDEDSWFPNSWLFEKKDPIVNVTSDEKDLFFFGVISKSEPYAYIMKPSEVNYADPVNKNLTSKKAVYERRIAFEIRKADGIIA